VLTSEFKNISIIHYSLDKNLSPLC